VVVSVGDHPIWDVAVLDTSSISFFKSTPRMDISKKLDPSALFSAKDLVIVITGGATGNEL